MLALTKPEKKILFAVLSILLVLCTMAYLSHRNSRLLITSSEGIEQAEEIKYHISEVLSVSVDMETGVRGYIITGDESYLEPANKAIADIFLHIHHLSSSPGITESQTNSIAELRNLVDEKTTLATRIIELRRQKGMDEALAIIAQGNEKKLMTQIRSLTGHMLREQDSRLTKLKEENKSVIGSFGITFYLLLLKIAVTVISVVLLLVFYFRKRNKSEKELRESQELFQNVLDHTSAAISIKDLSGKFMLINQAYENLFYIKKEKIKDKTVYDLFTKEVAEAIRSTDLEVIRTQQQMKIEEKMPHLAEMRHFVSLKFPLFDANKMPYAVCSISTDETETMEAEREHREQMKRIMDLFNNAPCGYQSSNKIGIIIEMNETLLRWLGYTREEVIGKMPLRNILSTESLEQFSYYFPRLRTGEVKTIFDIEVSLKRKDGSKFPVIANLVATYDDDGNFLYTRTSIFDTSYRKRVEELIMEN